MCENAENLIADEFSAEITDGVAYVSGYDDDSRPVLVDILLITFFFIKSKSKSELISTRKNTSLPLGYPLFHNNIQNFIFLVNNFE